MSRFVSLEAESQLMTASYNSDKSQLNSLSIDQTNGGDQQMTNGQNSLWDNWSD